MKKGLFLKTGFTLSELLIVMAIIVTISLVAVVALIRPQEKAGLDAAIVTMISDVKAQQTKAMSGNTGSSYGVYFENRRYVLFKGLAYDPNGSDNFSISLDSPIQIINITFPGSIVVFQKGSGEVFNFTSGQNGLTIRNTSGGESSTFVINKYGAIQKN